MSNFFTTELWYSFLDILFPEGCLACGAGLKGRQDISYCQACRQDVRLIKEPFCITCGKPFAQAAGANHHCGCCLKKKWYFAQARAAVSYCPPVREAVKMFKYNGKMHGLATFSALAQQFFQSEKLQKPDLIVPVPLHIKRLRQRGFNQALILSKKLFPQWKERIDPHILEKHYPTKPQTGLSGSGRRRNVSNVFRVREPEKIRDKKILLVDDVFTTGATVNECARILLRNQATCVDVFTFARVID